MAFYISSSVYSSLNWRQLWPLNWCALAVAGQCAEEEDLILEWSSGASDRHGYSMTSSPATHFQLSLWAGAGIWACHTRRLEQDGSWWRYRQPERSSDPTRIEKTLGRRELVITGCIGQPLLLSPSHYQVISQSNYCPPRMVFWCQECQPGIPGKDSPAMQVSSNDPLYF